jgi:hypothetical protein
MLWRPKHSKFEVVVPKEEEEEEDFDIIGELLMRYPSFVIKKKKKWDLNMEVHKLLKESKNICDLVRREVVCNVLSAFDIQIKLAGLVKMYLHEICTEVLSE